MSIFITGGTGYLGSYVITELLHRSSERLSLLVRGKDDHEARNKLWRAMQLHMDEATFYEILPRIDFFRGDLTAPKLGLEDGAWERLVTEATSVLHIAASLNRKSEKACLNTNLRGTLSVINLAQAMKNQGTLRRFSAVSTVAVAGDRWSEVVSEDGAIDWWRKDYDPYGRTKKFCEHMIRELLPDTPITIFRPSIVLGDSRKPETSQFEMIQAFCWMADMRVLPISPEGRLDIVNADFVGRAISILHLKEQTQFDTYHLSSGTRSKTCREVGDALTDGIGRRDLVYIPLLRRPFSLFIDCLNALPKGNIVQSIGALLKVFLPYIIYDTVFDNSRVTEEIGEAPVPFTHYCADLYAYSSSVNFKYPYVPLSKEPAP
jgi:thioester reductase-like protein